MPIIVTESDEIINIIGDAVESKMRSMFREFGFIDKRDTGLQAETEWLSLEDAKRILPIKSRKKWKQLRDFAEINFARAGKGFVYQKSSLQQYLLNNSTVTKPKKNENTKKK